MKYTIALISLFLVACSQPHPKTNVVITEKPIDTSKYTIFNFNPKRDDYMFDKKNKPASLTANEIENIEAIIKVKANTYNKHEIAFWDSLNTESNKKKRLPESTFRYNTIDHPEKYCKQFVVTTDSKGNKIAWVNCFCDKNEFSSIWKKEMVYVNDGGACFFYIKINLTNKTIISFGVNGLG